MKKLTHLTVFLCAVCIFVNGCGGKSQEDLDTELANAWAEGNINLVHQLLNEGADPNIQVVDSTGKEHSIIISASAKGDTETIRLLVEAGADLNAVDQNGQTPLHTAACTQTAKLLLELGSDVNAKDNNRLTPLHQADNKDIASLLLKKGATLEAKCQNGLTPLHYAASNSQTKIVTLLLDKGADVNALDDRERTPLHYAAMTDETEVVRLLLEQGAELEIMCLDDCTPLHYAASKGQTKMAKLFLNAGIMVNICRVTIPAGTPLVEGPQGWEPDKDFIEFGPTALYLALSEGHTEVAELLRKHGGVEQAEDLL